MASSKDKPKSASKITRNDGRRNGKAFGKNSGPTFTEPGISPDNSRGGKYGYSRKRLEKMARQQDTHVFDVIEQLGDKLADRADRAKHRPKTSAARPGIGEVTYKMTSVDRHFDKRRPYPCVPKGTQHAGKPEKKTDHRTPTKAVEMTKAAMARLAAA